MTRKNFTTNFARNMDALYGPAHCLNEIVKAWTEYLEISEEETTKRRKVEAWEKTALAEIKVKRDLLIKYLEDSFDERSRNFQSLFQVIDQSVASGNNQQLSLALHAVVELAKTSPFNELAELSNVKAAFDDPEHVWKL